MPVPRCTILLMPMLHAAHRQRLPVPSSGLDQADNTCRRLPGVTSLVQYLYNENIFFRYTRGPVNETWKRTVLLIYKQRGCPPPHQSAETDCGSPFRCRSAVRSFRVSISHCASKSRSNGSDGLAENPDTAAAWRIVTSRV
jgi:hypothetical protein